MTADRTLYLVTLAALVVASGVAVGLTDGGGGAPEPAGDGAFETTEAGVRYTVHPSELRQGCPAGMDCIPSIDDPRFVAADRATWLAAADLVIGVEIDGTARAYPLRILNVHEVVNDEVAGRPLAVTYCPLCRSGVVFSRAVGGRTLSFGVSGKLLDANLVLYDRQTETYWSQIEGEAIVGPLVPTRLELVPSAITTWDEWRRGHPETTVLSRETGIYPRATYASNPYAGYAESDRVGFGVDEVDDRLPPKALVYGVAAGGAAVAYPAAALADGAVVNDRVGEVPVLVVTHPADGGVRAFVRRAEGETLTFEATAEALVDDEGHRWTYDGEALSGPHEGTRLERIQPHGFYWFAWSEFHPETEVYRPAAG